MDTKSAMIPAATVLVAIGGYLTTLSAVADEAKEFEERLRHVEVVQAEQSASEVKLTTALQRLDRLEDMVSKNAEQLNKVSRDLARVCEATGARCGN